MIFQIENKNVHASDAGQGIDSKKDTIIFLHGSGLSHIVWSLAEQFFSNKNFNVLSLDLPGHGNSDGPCLDTICLLYTSPSPRDATLSRMPSSA